MSGGNSADSGSHVSSGPMDASDIAARNRQTIGVQQIRRLTVTQNIGTSPVAGDPTSPKSARKGTVFKSQTVPVGQVGNSIC